jgi:flagellar protein FlaJ
MARRLAIVIASLLWAISVAAAVHAQDPTHGATAGSLDPFFRSVQPADHSQVATLTPTIRATFALRENHPSDVVVRFMLDGNDTSELFRSDGSVNETGLEYTVTSLFVLKDGPHNVSVTVNSAGKAHTATWGFVVDLSPPPKQGAIRPETIVEAGLVLLGLIALSAAGLGAYLWRFKDYSWLKFRIRFPRQRQILPVYGSVYLSALATLLAILWLLQGHHPPRFTTEYLIVAAILIGLGPYAVDVKRRHVSKVRTERAFAQLLFELADALRGGIDPMKAIIELSKEGSGPLAQPLKVAADGLRLGRPFEQVMVTMTKPLDSSLVSRYAALVAEAAKVGGEISSVVHRAARDLDELVKINEERGRLMLTPVMTMYIAFGVLLWMVKSLMDFAPDLLNTDFAKSGLFGSDGAKVPRMSLPELQQRFLHLMLIASLGTGLLVGSFVEGKLRHGLLHSFAMILCAALFFRFLVLGA